MTLWVITTAHPSALPPHGPRWAFLTVSLPICKSVSPLPILILASEFNMRGSRADFEGHARLARLKMDALLRNLSRMSKTPISTCSSTTHERLTDFTIPNCPTNRTIGTPKAFAMHATRGWRGKSSLTWRIGRQRVAGCEYKDFPWAKVTNSRINAPHSTSHVRGIDCLL